MLRAKHKRYDQDGAVGHQEQVTQGKSRYMHGPVTVVTYYTCVYMYLEKLEWMGKSRGLIDGGWKHTICLNNTIRTGTHTSNSKVKTKSLLEPELAFFYCCQIAQRVSLSTHMDLGFRVICRENDVCIDDRWRYLGVEFLVNHTFIFTLFLVTFITTAYIPHPSQNISLVDKFTPFVPQPFPQSYQFQTKVFRTIRTSITGLPYVTFTTHHT